MPGTRGLSGAERIKRGPASILNNLPAETLNLDPYLISNGAAVLESPTKGVIWRLPNGRSIAKKSYRTRDEGKYLYDLMAESGKT